MVEHLVLLECGHWFVEHMAEPVDLNHSSWKNRACGHPEHYPRQYAAVYLPAQYVPLSFEVHRG